MNRRSFLRGIAAATLLLSPLARHSREEELIPEPEFQVTTYSFTWVIEEDSDGTSNPTNGLVRTTTLQTDKGSLDVMLEKWRSDEPHSDGWSAVFQGDGGWIKVIEPTKEVC